MFNYREMVPLMARDRIVRVKLTACQIALFVLLCASAVAQSTNVLTPMTVCQVLQSPERYSGKVVVLSGDILSPRALQMYDPSCGRVSLAYTEDDLKIRPKFTTVRDGNFKKFDSSLSELVPPPPCKPGRITATVEGRFDSRYALRKGKRVVVSPGFGHQSLSDYQLVVKHVLIVDVEPASCTDTN